MPMKSANDDRGAGANSQGSLCMNGNIDSAENRKVHVEAIHAKQNAIKAGVCPRCGGKLVERNGRYGKFMGCSNYPKCRYVQKM